MTGPVGVPNFAQHPDEEEQAYTLPAPPPSGAYVLVPPLRPLRDSDFSEIADEPTLTEDPRLDWALGPEEAAPTGSDTDPAPPPGDAEE
jgi:hypothetical protein